MLIAPEPLDRAKFSENESEGTLYRAGTYVGIVPPDRYPYFSWSILVKLDRALFGIEIEANIHSTLWKVA
jgi:hypothetical protein